MIKRQYIKGININRYKGVKWNLIFLTKANKHKKNKRYVHKLNSFGVHKVN